MQLSSEQFDALINEVTKVVGAKKGNYSPITILLLVFLSSGVFTVSLDKFIDTSPFIERCDEVSSRIDAVEKDVALIKYYMGLHDETSKQK